MKKVYLIIVMALVAMTSFAEDYVCGMAMDVYGEPQDFNTVKISCVKNEAGKYDITLDNFSFGTIPVGTVNVNNVDVVEEDEGMVQLHSEQSISIAIMPGIQIPLVLNGTLIGKDIFIHLDISDVGVKLLLSSIGTQLQNGGFEEWHKVNASDATENEPNAWHHIMSATGGLASVVKNKQHVFPTDDVRPGTTGKKAVKMESSSVLGVSANGTITTGRMKVGSPTASDPNNCTFMDLSLTDVDGNGQLFDNNIAGEPTALHFWYKFKMVESNSGNAANKTASVNALLTDGTYCQDTADKEYNNIVAVAKDVTSMGDTNGEWKEMTVNFSYKDVDVSPASLLITFSTCAVAGGGSSDNNDPDVLYIDDVELVYAPVPVALNIFDIPVEGFSADKTTYNVTVPEVPTDMDIDFECENGCSFSLSSFNDKSNVLTVNLYNEDLKFQKAYTLNLTIDPTGVENVKNVTEKTVVSRVNLAGQQVKTARGITITKYSDGTTEKRIK